jgi:acetyl esterase/lipase
MNNQFGWSSLQGDYRLDDERLAYFSPARAADLAGMPPMFIAIGSLDLFLDESLAFALRASSSGVPIECHVYPGAVHGFDLMGDTSLGRQFAADKRAALARWMRS